MNINKLRPLNRQSLYDLIRTSRGEAKCDIYINGGTVINVYTGELLKANVAIKGRNIAYVGSADNMVGGETEVIQANGMYLCPGYIEPHAHPFQTYNPVSLSEKAMSLGTTTLVCDNLFFFMAMNEQRLMNLWHELSGLPVKLLWSVRLDPQTYSKDRSARFSREKIEFLLNNPLARQVGELTDWPSLVAGQDQMLDNILLAGYLGKKVEGHAPGASPRTLNTLAAGGVTDCHESITGEEVINRLRLGMYATLRHSSLRPDLPGIIKEILSKGIETRRAMITTDGATPPGMRYGLTDYILHLAINEGLPYIEAYRMATINPATYYGLDDQLGGIAPGRLADIVFLDDPENPTPRMVIADGIEVAKEGRTTFKLTEPKWSDYGLTRVNMNLSGLGPEDMIPVAINGVFPVMKLVNPVITKRKDTVLPVRSGIIDLSDTRNLVYAALIDKDGKWICSGILEGFADNLAGLACSNTITGDILALGRNPVEMILSIRRIREMGGGIALSENESIIYELPLPLGGIMNDNPVDKLIENCTVFYKLLARRGHRHYDPLYTILFLSATHLPELRLSPSGLLSVKDKVIIIPVKRHS